MRLAPTEKFVASLVMTNASKLSPGPPALRVCKIKLIMSAPSEFILLWNSMHPTPSPRSTSEAPEFFFHHSVGFLRHGDRPHAGGNLYRPQVLRSQLPVLCVRRVTSDHRCTTFSAPAAKSLSTFAPPACLLFSCERLWPRRQRPSQSSKRAESQLKPRRMARSISTIEFEISGTRFAE